MASYIEITDAEIQPNAPYTTGLAAKMRDNHIAMGTRQSGAPWLNGIGALEVITSSQTWIVPDDVYRLKYRLCAGGGGGTGRAGSGSTAGNSGGSTSFGVYGSATGGEGGKTVLPSATPGTGTGGDINIGAQTNGLSNLGPSPKGLSSTGDGNDATQGYGNGAGSAYDSGVGQNGAGGGYAEEVIDVTPGESIIITIGAGGSGGNSTYDGGDGNPGVVIIEY